MNIQSPTTSSEAKLTAVQQQRYDYLFPIYGRTAASIVTNIYGKGKNSWASFLEKMDLVMEAKAFTKEYYNALYDTFVIGEAYPPGQIIGDVNDTRRQLGLVPYTEKIKLQSEHDFNLVFIVEEILESSVDGVLKGKLVGYRPLVKVMPSE
jgi:hypothetical protein